MDLIQPMAAIVFVAAMLGGALLLLRDTRKTGRGVAQCSSLIWSLRGASPPEKSRLEVIERVSLGPHHAVHLVRAEDRLVLIATAPSSCQLLDHAASTGEKA